MAGRRMTRADMPNDPGGVIRALGACRDVMLKAQREVRVSGPVYYAAQMVISAIDAFATLLTGQRCYFGIGGSTGHDATAQTLEDQRMREAGEKPWRADDDPLR